MDVAIRLLKTVDHYNTSKDPDKDELWMCIQKLKGLHRNAWNKMRLEFLDPRKTAR